MAPTNPKPDPTEIAQAKAEQAEKEARRLAQGRARMAERDAYRAWLAAAPGRVIGKGQTPYSKRQLAQMDEDES